ncbi:hypothetical protein [Mesotoga sp. B105.6.4]|uniref:hypothetical protein n=1 Tax=Mesotoga sp. B105.6.4 TaxID=1582224 RepID=UPI0015E0D8C1|nr:hypothetical protein [Mesotoga sp. B105.6.4]
MAKDVCFKEEHGEHEMRREDEKQERVLVTREEREKKPVRLELKLTPSQASL